MGPCPPLWGSLLGVYRLCYPRSLYVLSSFLLAWVRLTSVFAEGSVVGIPLVVVAVRVFFAFVSLCSLASSSSLFFQLGVSALGGGSPHPSSYRLLFVQVAMTRGSSGLAPSPIGRCTWDGSR